MIGKWMRVVIAWHRACRNGPLKRRVADLEAQMRKMAFTLGCLEGQMAKLDRYLYLQAVPLQGALAYQQAMAQRQAQVAAQTISPAEYAAMQQELQQAAASVWAPAPSQTYCYRKQITLEDL